MNRKEEKNQSELFSYIYDTGNENYKQHKNDLIPLDKYTYCLESLEIDQVYFNKHLGNSFIKIFKVLKLS